MFIIKKFQSEEVPKNISLENSIYNALYFEGRRILIVGEKVDEKIRLQREVLISYCVALAYGVSLTSYSGSKTLAEEMEQNRKMGFPARDLCMSIEDLLPKKIGEKPLLETFSTTEKEEVSMEEGSIALTAGNLSIARMFALNSSSLREYVGEKIIILKENRGWGPIRPGNIGRVNPDRTINFPKHSNWTLAEEGTIDSFTPLEVFLSALDDNSPKELFYRGFNFREFEENLSIVGTPDMVDKFKGIAPFENISGLATCYLKK